MAATPALLLEEARKAEKPMVTVEDAAMLAQRLFGIYPVPGSVESLDSYDDRNFRLRASGGDALLVPADANGSFPPGIAQYVLKVHNGVESMDPGFIDAQNLAMLRVRASGIWCPRALASVDSTLIARAELPLANGTLRKHAVRLLPYRPGTLLGSAPRLLTAPVLRRLGETAAKVTAALNGFDHPGAHRQFFIWDLAQCLDLRPLLPSLPEDRRAVIGAVLDEFEARVVPLSGRLPRAVVHGDINDQNVLIDEPSETVTGLLDFGDLSHTWRVCELAIAAAYALIALHYGASAGGAGVSAVMGEEEAATALVSGFVAELTRLGLSLNDAEWEVLPTLIAVRIAMSLTLGNYSSAKDPSNEYLRLTLLPGWLALQRLRATPAADLRTRLRLAADAAAATAATGALFVTNAVASPAPVVGATTLVSTLTPRRGGGGRPKGSKDKVKRKPGGGRPKGAKDKHPRVRRLPVADLTGAGGDGMPLAVAARLEGGDGREVVVAEAGAEADGSEVLAVVDAAEVIAVEAAMELTGPGAE